MDVWLWKQCVVQDYLPSQPDLIDKFRSICVDWLVCVAEKFKACHQTLFLTISIMDTYLGKQKKCVYRTNLQLICATCFFIAFKFEETVAYNYFLKNLKRVSQKAFKKKQVLHVELDILSTLGFQLMIPTPFQFLEATWQSLDSCHHHQKTWHLSCYIAECSLQEYGLLISYKPSMIAASALLFAVLILSSESDLESVRTFIISKFKII